MFQGFIDLVLPTVAANIGNYFSSKTFESKAEAEVYERSLKLKKNDGDFFYVNGKRFILASEYFSEWLEYRRTKVSRGWFKNVESIYKTYVVSELGKLKLCNVKPPHIGKVLGKMQDLGRSAQTILHVYNLLSKGFKDAVEYHGYLDRSPVLKQDRPERAYLSPLNI